MQMNCDDGTPRGLRGGFEFVTLAACALLLILGPCERAVAGELTTSWEYSRPGFTNSWPVQAFFEGSNPNDVLTGPSFNDCLLFGQNGEIARTTDGGATWTRPSSGVSARLLAADRVGSLVVSVGATGTIVRSEDSGASWTTIPSGTTVTLRSVDFVDGKNGWAVGGQIAWEYGINDQTILHTHDGGLTWTQLSGRGAKKSWRHYPLHTVRFLDKKRGFIAGDYTLWSTADGGHTWKNIWPNPEDFGRLWTLEYGDRSHLVAVGTNYGGGKSTAYTSMDGGVSWQRLLLPQGYSVPGEGRLESEFSDAVDIQVTADNQMYLYDSWARLFVSRDFGRTWYWFQPTPTSIDPTTGPIPQLDAGRAFAAFDSSHLWLGFNRMWTPSWMADGKGIAGAGRGVLQFPSRSTVSIAKSKRKIRRGKKVTISGRLARPGAAARGARIVLEQVSKGSWKRVAVARTGAAGKYSFRLKPRSSAVYRVGYAGSGPLRACVSKVTTVKVVR